MDEQGISTEGDTLVLGSEVSTGDEDESIRPDRDLSRRSRGEELWLWRLRRLSPSGKVTGRGGTGMSQAEAAAFLGIDLGAYADAEKDACAVRDIARVLGYAYARHAGDQPTVGELCALARRRSGMRLADVEAELGLTRPAYLAAETSGDERVVALWCGKGYQFS